MIYFLCGKMTGKEDYGRKDFAEAEKKLGVFLNPKDVILNPAILPIGMAYEKYIGITSAMVDAADAVVLLPDWKESDGARKEMARALRTGKKMFHLPVLSEVRDGEVL